MRDSVVIVGLTLATMAFAVGGPSPNPGTNNTQSAPPPVERETLDEPEQDASPPVEDSPVALDAIGDSLPDSPAMPADSLDDVPAVELEADGIDSEGRQVTMHCWGVPIGKGRVATAAHLIDGIRLQRVRVDGRVQRFFRHQDHDIDFALAHYHGDTAVPFRLPVYRESVRVYARKTGKVMRGFVCGPGVVSLDPDEPGIRSGDSGCAVVAESGELIGVVSGFPSKYKSWDAENRVVNFEPIIELQIPVAVASLVPAAGTPPAESSPPQSGESHISVVEIGADWCGPCRAMRPIVERLRAEGLPIVTLDGDRDSEARQYRATTYPTWIVMRDGKEVGRYTGSMTEARLRGLFR